MKDLFENNIIDKILLFLRKKQNYTKNINTTLINTI